MTHYKLTEETITHNGVTLHRIELTEDCKWGYKGTKGGFIEKIENLSGNAWVSGDARVSGNAQVYGDALVSGKAKVQKTSDYMTISSLGDSNRTITITFSDKMIACGCFRGTIYDFKKAVDKKYNGKGNYYPTISYIESLFKLIEDEQR
jgi:hypothetical protein